MVERGEDALRSWDSGSFGCGITETLYDIEISRDELALAMTTEMAASSPNFQEDWIQVCDPRPGGIPTGSMNALLTPEQIGRAG